MRWAGVLVALSACGRIGFDAGDGGLADSPLTDASTDSSTGGACTAPGVACTFPGGLPCSCFGSPMFSNAGLQENSGTHLRITPNANTIGAQGSCVRTGTPFGRSGAIVEVAQVVSGAQGLTAIQLGGGADVFTLSQRGGQMIAEDGGGLVNAIAYTPALMRWWRIRPDPLGVAYEVSIDGMGWNLIALSTRTPSTTYTVRIIGGTLGAIAAPGFAQFNSVNVCGP